MNDAINPDAPKARLCHLKKTQDFAGYGFNLHAEKGKAGQYIGDIDPGSPAERAGLKKGDRIVEVNGTNIGNENHQQVVQRIKSVDDETRLLVVDSEADQFYKDNKIVVRGDLPNVQYISSEIRSNGTADSDHGSIEKEPMEGPSSGDGHPLRLCALIIWPDFQGYGFNLHAEKGKPGQFIGKVDDNSPAQTAGLREGDRLLEVNGSAVSAESHADVVSRIKAIPGQVELLVVDPVSDESFKEQGITLHSGLPTVVRMECPASRPSDNSSNGSTSAVEAEVINHTAAMRISDDEEEKEASSALQAVENAMDDEEKEEPELEEEKELNNNRDEADNYETIGAVEKDKDEEMDEPHQDYEAVDIEETKKSVVVEEITTIVSSAPEPAREPVEPVSPASPTTPTVVGGIEFASSAAAAREKVQGRRKRDGAKSQNLSAKDKYDMFMKL